MSVFVSALSIIAILLYYMVQISPVLYHFQHIIIIPCLLLNKFQLQEVTRLRQHIIIKPCLLLNKFQLQEVTRLLAYISHTLRTKPALLDVLKQEL